MKREENKRNDNFLSKAVVSFGAGVRLRCPAETSPDGAGSFLADRCTRCAFASSATGSAKARGQTLTSGSSPTGNKNMGYPVRVSHILVPVTGLEPVRVLPQGILSPWCLPIPPHRRQGLWYHNFCLASSHIVEMICSTIALSSLGWAQ